jgi:hypothetical protein
MPPGAGSRYLFCQGVRDEDGNVVLTEREPYRFHEHPDTRVHVVREGDSLFTLAGKYFAPLPRACGYWWAIADFQPEPVFDPTIDLEIRATLLIPSVRVLQEVILGEGRRREFA